MTLRDMPQAISSQVHDLRERATATSRIDSFWTARAVSRLRDRIDGVEERLGDRLDRLERLGELHASELAALGNRTTWPRRFFWLTLGAGVGMAVAYLADPERGRTRRAQFSDQLAARARDVRNEASKEARYAAGRTRGAIHETTKEMLPEDVPSDPKLLEQRIRSEVFGHREDTTEVVIRVDRPGAVALKGTVPDHDSERSLVGAVAGVEGVIDVTSELTVRSD